MYAPFPGSNSARASFITSQRDTTAVLTTHTISVDCGLGGVVVAGLSCTFNGTISSVSIGGVSAPINVQRQAGGNNAPVAIATASGVGSGVQNIVLSTSAGNQTWTAFTYNLSGANSSTPTGSGSQNAVSGTMNFTISTATSGCVIGIGRCSNGTAPATWAVLIKDLELDNGSQVESVASLNDTTLNAALPASLVFGGTSGQEAVVWAAWSP